LLFAQNTPGTEKLPAPLFVAQGTADTVVWPDVTQQFTTSLCQNGSTVALKLYEGADHFAVRTTSAPDTVVWIKDRFAGQPAPSTCS
jgi:dipeptidyl aminopeptidase/acylaminoacyl peptidase